MAPPADRSLDFAERWLRDGLQVLRPSLMIYQATVDMSRPLAVLEQLRQQGVQATPTHVLVHAVARALAANPDLHQIVESTHRMNTLPFSVKGLAKAVLPAFVPFLPLAFAIFPYEEVMKELKKLADLIM